jgi:SAM-dependent methyltransferase
MELSDDARYDLIFVGGVLMYLNDDVVGEMVAKLRRMLAPGGLLILRESTSQPEPWYRDTPLSPGLFAEPAEPGQPRPPYFAIYRRPETYRQLAEARALQLVHSQPNRDYKLADLTESTLRWIDRLRGGALRRDRLRAERAAQWIYRLRHLLLLPRYYLTRWFAPRTWKINNHWFVCRAKAGAAPEPGAPATAAAPAPSPAAPATRSS